MSTPFRFPDQPLLCSLDHLKKMDDDPPGTWLAQSKLDGRRRFAVLQDGKWTYRAKNRDDAQALPADLRASFEAIPWPDGLGLDFEFCGLRKQGDQPSIWIFDMFRFHNADLFNMRFDERVARLSILGAQMLLTSMPSFDSSDVDCDNFEHLHFVESVPNPGLVDFFVEQMQNPLSEGIVVRRADSTMIGSYNKCAENSAWVKCKFDRVKEAGR